MLLWDYNYCLELLNKAEQIYEKFNPHHLHLGSVSVNKGIIYRKMRNYDRAITFYNHAIIVFEKQLPIDYESLRIIKKQLNFIITVFYMTSKNQSLTY